jgi:hypothetical protein
MRSTRPPLLKVCRFRAEVSGISAITITEPVSSSGVARNPGNPSVCLVAALCGLCVAGVAPAAAQSAAPTAEPAWSVRVSANTYLIPDADNYLQPTMTADRGAVHVESRYQYEDRNSTSMFLGWNLSFGDTVKLSLTPMFGGVFGQTAGVVPALEADITWRRLEAYAEGEYVIDAGDRGNSFLYNWSEVSVWATEWLRGGIVTQRTRVLRTPRDIQRGLLIGAAVSKIESAIYLFNPGSSDHFIVVSVGVRF